MSKNDNLTDLLTDVADAIRAKKGTSDKINPQDFSSEIASIEVGGSDVEIASSDITYYDYDGTVLYAYTWDEWIALGAEDYEPPLPEHDGLICQGWTTLKPNTGSAPSWESDYTNRHLCFGAIYITDDGKTRLYIRVNIGRQTIPLSFNQTVTNGVTIDWGDGSATKTISGTGIKDTEHTYASAGDYVITLDVANRCTMYLGRNRSSDFVFGKVSAKLRGVLRKVEVGKNVTKMADYTFHYCHNLETITLPNSITSIGLNTFRYCYSLKHITMPDAVTSIGNYTFGDCYSLKSVVMPISKSSGSTYMFYNCYALENLSALTTGALALSCLYNCYSLTKVSLFSNMLVAAYALRNCYSLTYIKLKCDSIATSAFDGCESMKVYDFTPCTSVPTLADTIAFDSIPSDCKIVVPDSLYDSWIAATNWSTLAYYIIKKSDYEAQNA